MTKELFIHVGAGKTGTTALQEFINCNKDKLQSNGVSIANVGVVMAGSAITHHKLADWGVHQGLDFLSLWKEIADLKDDRILLSSEYFHSRISEKDGVDFFGSIRDLFTDRNVKIIFYIRRQSEWIQSAYEQWVKANALSLTIEQFSRNYRKNLSDQIFRFAEVFGKENIIVKPYDKNQFKNGNIFADFFDILGVNIDDSYVFPVGNVNPRLTSDALDFKRVFNSFCKDKKESRIVQHDLGRYSGLVRESSENQARHYRNDMPQDLQKSIEEDNREKYVKIATEYLGRENGKLFSEEIKYSQEQQSDQISSSDSSQLYPFLFLQMYKKIQFLSRKNEELESKLEQLSNRIQ